MVSYRYRSSVNRALVYVVPAFMLTFWLCPRATADPIVQGMLPAASEPPSLHLSVAASAEGLGTQEQAGGLECDTRIEAGGADIRLWVLQAFEAEFPECPLGSPAAGLGVSLPYLRFGTMKPAGLAAFVHAPASSETLLLAHSGTPLVLDDPADPACLGIALGEDYGVFLEAPAASAGLLDLGRVAWGGWFSPRTGFLSALALVSGSPAEAGGPGWYDVPVPGSQRASGAVWGPAVGSTAGAPAGATAGTTWAVAAAAAGSAGFPGTDAAALRAEARISAGGFRLDAEGSAASVAWVGPDGRSAPFLRLAADARFGRLGYAAVLGFRYAKPDVPGSEAGSDCADAAWSGALEARSWFGQARVSASLQTRTGAPETEAAAAVEVDARWKPGFAPWLALASSWRAMGGEAERIDLSTQAAFGKTLRVQAESGLRFVPEGLLVKGPCSIARSFGALWVGGSVRTSGWIEPADDWLGSLSYSLKMTATLK